jgi:hypothetical protein
LFGRGFERHIGCIILNLIKGKALFSTGAKVGQRVMKKCNSHDPFSFKWQVDISTYVTLSLATWFEWYSRLHGLLRRLRGSVSACFAIRAYNFPSVIGRFPPCPLSLPSLPLSFSSPPLSLPSPLLNLSPPLVNGGPGYNPRKIF